MSDIKDLDCFDECTNKLCDQYGVDRLPPDSCPRLMVDAEKKSGWVKKITKTTLIEINAPMTEHDRVSAYLTSEGYRIRSIGPKKINLVTVDETKVQAIGVKITTIT